MPRKPVRARRRAAVEPLEGRVLLSGTTHFFAHTTYQILRSGATLSPDTSGGITPAQMAQAYGINKIKFGSVTGDGTGQTIAIIDAYDDPNAAADLHAFDVQFGLPDAPSFTKLNETGGTTLPGTDPSPKGNDWEVEESLDIEWAHAIAPQASIILYEANSASDGDLIQAAAATAANNPSVTAISMSFGGGEFSGETSEDSVFTSTHATFFASTGDFGAPGGYPAYSPNVVAVGGTSLNIDSSGNYIGETGWSGSGGGISSQEPEPSYQNGVQNTGARTIPDVSMDADPGTGVFVYDSYDSPSNPLFVVGGTSLSSPMWAGLIAIADQGRVANGLSPLGSSQALPLIYQSPPNNFHDIVSGNNSGFSAHAGYDEVTGRGTPIANLLIPFLAGTKPTVNSFSGSPNPVAPGTNVTLTANVTDPDAAVTTVAFYRESNGTSGLQTGAGGDTFLGNGTSNGSGGWTLSTSTTGLNGSVTYYAVPTDASSVTGSTASTTVTVTSQVLVTGVAVNGNNPALAGAQRSMVSSIVYTFSAAVTLNSGGFTFAVHAGEPGTVPSLAWAAINPDAGGASTQWVVTFSGTGTVGGSIGDGVYDITLNASAATVEGNPTGTVAARPTDTFYRLYGDITGDGRVNNADYNQFLNAFNTKSGQTGFIAGFDASGTGSRIGNADYNLFLNNFNVRYTGFTATI